MGLREPAGSPCESLTEEFQSLQVLEGSLPENPGECFLDESFALSQGIQVGDEITISEDVKMKRTKS